MEDAGIAFNSQDARKGPRSTPPHPRPYYEDHKSRVEGRGWGGVELGPLRASSGFPRAHSSVSLASILYMRLDSCHLFTHQSAMFQLFFSTSGLGCTFCTRLLTVRMLMPV
jgi:hypothetical protein